MKKYGLCGFLAAFLCGCGTDEGGGAALTGGGLLDGTEWRTEGFDAEEVPELFPNLPQEVDDSGFETFFSDAELVCTEVKVTSTETFEEKSRDVSWPRAKLVFSGNTCRYYEDSGYTLTETVRADRFSQTSTYAPQSRVSSKDPNVTLEVNRDGIFVCYTYPLLTGLKTEARLYRALDNYRYTRTWTDSTVVKTEKTYNGIREETFYCQCILDEIVLTSGGKKWIGTLDTDDWTIAFIQIVPERKELPIFHLK